jgi:hypothetical protein
MQTATSNPRPGRDDFFSYQCRVHQAKHLKAPQSTERHREHRPQRPSNNVIAGKPSNALTASHSKRCIKPAAMPKTSKRTTKNSSKRGAPFFEPPPKHENASSTVTPSPKVQPSNKKQKIAKESPVSQWIVHDKLLSGARDNPFETDSQLEVHWRKLVTDELTEAVDKLFRDPMFEHAQFVKKPNPDPYMLESYNEFRRYKQFALNLSKYPTSAIQQVMEEHTKDMALHDELLKSLREEINEKRYGGKRFYLRALNCILFDSFVRCHVPLPPVPTWDIEVEIGAPRKYLYLKQLRAWDAHKRRIFAIMKVVIAHPIEMEGTVKVPNVVELKHRGEMVPMNGHCQNEEECIHFKEVALFDKERMLDIENENLDDKPACGCKVCKKGFQALIERVVDAREEGMNNL